MDEKDFENCLERALKEIPDNFRKYLDNVIISWDNEPDSDILHKMGSGTLFGLYQGVPLPERNTAYNMILPDKITIFKKPIERHFKSKSEIIKQIKRTLIHELGHYFGLSEIEIRNAMNDWK